MARTSSLLTLLIALLFLSSCGGGDNNKTADISNIKVTLQTYRFDKDMYAIDTNHIADGLVKLRQKYPDFLDFFVDTLMPYGIHGNYSDTAAGIRQGLREYLTFHDYVDLQDTIMKYYPDTRATDAAITEAYRYMKYYLPATTVPRIIYINRILSNSTPVFSVDSTLSCICLDRFLGPQFPIYASVGVPGYMGPHMRSSYIPVAHFRDVYEATHQFVIEDRTLLDLMIQRGKEQYFLHKIMPASPDSVLFGFTGIQVTFCEKNEAELYNYFIQNNLLYNKHEMTIGTYVVDGPFAKGIGSPTDPGSPTPGNIGTWMGYRIVAAYMAQNPKMTLKELLDSKPEPGKFLEAAHYKPR